MRSNRKNEKQSERISGIVGCVPVSALLVSYVHFVCQKELVTKYVRLLAKVASVLSCCKLLKDGSLSAQRGSSSGCRWRQRHPDTDGNGQCIEKKKQSRTTDKGWSFRLRCWARCQQLLAVSAYDVTTNLTRPGIQNDLAQDRDGWRALVNAVMNLLFYIKCGEFLAGTHSVSRHWTKARCQRHTALKGPVLNKFYVPRRIVIKKIPPSIKFRANQSSSIRADMCGWTDRPI